MRLQLNFEVSEQRGDCAASLRAMTTTSLFAKTSLFQGSVGGLTGRLWLRRRVGWALAARSLHFNLAEMDEGCILRGEWRTVLPLKTFVVVYWTFCAVWGAAFSVLNLLHHTTDFRTWRAAILYPLECALGFYLWLRCLIWLGQRAETRMLKILKHVCASEQASLIVVDLLTSSR